MENGDDENEVINNIDTNSHSDSDSKSTVPVIDMREFGDLSDSEKAYEKLREACEEWGCFRIINHGISPALMSEMKTVVRSLLDLPAEIKQRNTDVIAGSGYMAPSPVNPLYEALGLYDLGSPEALRSFFDQLDASPYQRDVIEKYAKGVHEMAMDMGRKLAKSLGVKSDLFKGWTCQFRINKYNFNPQSVGSSGVQLHTDSGFLTVLQEDENVGGLEVMNKNGEFVAVEPCPGTLLLNLGDVARAWSNGRFCNVKHRVQCKEAAVRVSIASFLLGPKDETVEAPQELVDSEHPRLYLPFSYEDYRSLRLSKKLHAGEALQLIQAHIA
ncbi:2-oxoglutarate-dependent dioxygenase DAO-like [Humulus lupulus]|uniref:2-oxoglutarate-dependent dioxygenase DAO-like n=1 Tax=Humulus lupulus TaxID=3486 RepID=UPI002B410601|nr:2-oxoglutarate-dependent dioxygenase DAO-like [Humulus lupulus]